MTDICLTLFAVLAEQGDPVAGDATEVPDFRNWVWIAYASVIVLMTIFTLYTVVQVKGAQRRMAHLEERLEKKESAVVKTD